MRKIALLTGLSFILFGCGQQVEVVSPMVKGITLSNTYMEIRVDESNPLTVSYEPTGSSSPVVWSSSDESIATVSIVGVVQGVSEGTATIVARTARNMEVSASCEVLILPRREPDILVSSIKLAKTSAELEVGQTFYVGTDIEILPENAANRNVTWSSSNTKVASVNSIGMVKAMAAGTATIFAKAADASGVSATCVIKVKATQKDPDTPEGPDTDPQPDPKIKVVFDSCDNLDNFTQSEKHRTNVSVMTKGRQEGTGYIRRITNSDAEIFIFSRQTPIDSGISDKSKGHLCFYFYIDDAEKLRQKAAASGRVEISHSGAPSLQCLAWSSKTYLADLLVDGWNFIDLPFKFATEVTPDNPFNPAGPKYFRIYFDGPAATTEFEYGIDCIGFYEE